MFDSSLTDVRCLSTLELYWQSTALILSRRERILVRDARFVCYRTGMVAFLSLLFSRIKTSCFVSLHAIRALLALKTANIFHCGVNKMKEETRLAETGHNLPDHAESDLKIGQRPCFGTQKARLQVRDPAHQIAQSARFDLRQCAHRVIDFPLQFAKTVLTLRAHSSLPLLPDVPLRPMGAPMPEKCNRPQPVCEPPAIDGWRSL
ncbi:hypothetical protein DF3PB_1360006 [uncultured Defluviicoccus sp.]|uniref:Uncharacterized protein n=1 Tax=metagenome TaxID=256318 RepID=A0A380T9H2_9ZZZZ|nr:hypothetical protein DF3PB_1360006 [uncultured Defluviicoccus sp.]